MNLKWLIKSNILIPVLEILYLTVFCYESKTLKLVHLAICVNFTELDERAVISLVEIYLPVLVILSFSCSTI